MRKKRNKVAAKDRHCFFCKHDIDVIDYKDIHRLRRFTSSYAKIVPRKRSGVCVKHQRKLSASIKRARVIALLPYVVK